MSIDRWVLLCLVCLTTFFVDNSVLVPDIMESGNIVTAREMVYDGNWIAPTMNGELRLEKPPLPTWLTAVVEMIAPDNLGWQRGVAGLAALLLVFYFYCFVKNILGVAPFVSALILCTCHNVILMGRTASWDIYCHAFMMGAVYHLAVAIKGMGGKWRHCIVAGVLAGLSIMSKGPVSVYALLLPFVIAFAFVMRPCIKGCRVAIGVMSVIALVVGGWWFVIVPTTIRACCPDGVDDYLSFNAGITKNLFMPTDNKKLICVMDLIPGDSTFEFKMKDTFLYNFSLIGGNAVLWLFINGTGYAIIFQSGKNGNERIKVRMELGLENNAPIFTAFVNDILVESAMESTEII